jgi:hypothetical protein
LFFSWPVAESSLAIALTVAFNDHDDDDLDDRRPQ